MLKLDKEFYESYFNHYGKMSPFKVVVVVANSLKSLPGFTLAEAMNVVKTSALLGQTYLDFYAELAKKYLSFVTTDNNVDRMIFNVAFHYMHVTKPVVLESFLDTRFTIRDIYKEIAEDAYGVANEETIAKVKAIKTEHTYSVQSPRPETRDKWFYDMAIAVGSYSKCHSRKIGAVLVKDNSVISTGYNGPPRGVPTCDQRWYIDEAFKEKYSEYHKADTMIRDICPRRVIGFPSGQGLEICPAGHAERNALINAARLGIKTNNTKLYMTCGVPCSPCMVEIINSGVEEIICTSMDIYDDTAMYLLENCDIKVRIFDFLV